MTFKLLTDSTADLPQEWIAQHDVDVVGLTIQLDGVSYETAGQHAISTPELLNKMRAGEQPTTSQVNVGQFEEYFRQAAEDSQAVLYMAFSSVLSGTYQSSVIARDLVLEDYPDAQIILMDTLAASCGEGYLVTQAERLRAEGATVSQVVDWVEDRLPRLRTFFLVDDLYHLMRGGRLSKASALVGSLVNIKPLLWLDATGKLVPLAKSRGRKRAMKEMVERATDQLGDSTAIVAYADDDQAAQELKESLLAIPEITEVLVWPLGPVISAHVGPGTLAVFTFGREAR